MLIEPDELEDLVVGELGGSALFGARFRENAGRALLIPRAYPGRRTPLWQQRLKSQSLLEVARRYAQFPIVLETYREVLRDVLDLPGLHDLLTKLHRRELSLVEVETQTASPFASSLLFDYVATYMYEGDQPNAERRAAALALDRELLRELLGQEELRELIDPGALETVEADLQRLSERTRADSVDALHDVLRRVGDLTLDEAVLRGGTQAWLEQLAGERRAIELRVGGEQRWVAAEDAGLYRDALGAVPPSGLPEAFIADVPDAMERLVRRYARTHGPFETRELRDRYGIDLTPGAGAAGAGRGARARRAAPRRHGARVVRPRGPAPAAPGLAGRAARRDRARRPARLRPLPGVLAGRRPPPAERRGDRPPARGARPAAGAARCRSRSGSATCCRAAPAPTRPPGWTSCARAARSSGSARARSGRRSGRVALYFRDDAPLIGPPPRSGEAPVGAGARAVRERLQAGPCFFTDLLTDVAGFTDRGAAERGSGTSCGRARRPTTPSRRCARRS